MKKLARKISTIETLEARIAPATLSIAGDGTVTYTAGASAFNFLLLTMVNGGSKYRFDDSENITVSGVFAGEATGSGTSIVDVNAGAVRFISIALGDQNDTLTVDKIIHPLTVVDGAGNDTVSFSTTAKIIPGNVSVAAETINVNAALTVNSGTVTFSADTMAINSAVSSAGSRITIQTLTAGRGISLGTENAGQLSLTSAELSNLIANDLTIGSTSSGAIELSAAMVSAAGSLVVKTGASVSTTGTGSLNATAFGVVAGGTVSLTGANSFVFFAMSAGGNGVSTIRDNNGFDIGTVDGVSGIANNTGTTVLNTGSITQSSPVVTGSLALTGSGPFNLSLATNSIGALAANTSAVNLKTNGPLSVQTIGSVVGITTGYLELTAADLNITSPIDLGITGWAFLSPSSSNAPIILAGAALAGSFNLDLSELNLITSVVLGVGNSITNPITVGGSFSRTGILELSGSDITGAGAITAFSLLLNAGGTISLNGANNVDFLSVEGPGLTGLTFVDDNGFSFGRDDSESELNLSDFTAASLNAANGTVTFRSDQYLNLSIGAAGNDQISVTGGVSLSTILTLNQTGTLPTDTTFLLLDNDGTDAISGTFGGLPEGALVPGINPPARISYLGGDGNDITIRTAEALAADIATDGKSATFRDVDGDFVTIKTTKGTFTPASFSGYKTGIISGAQLQTLTLDSTFTGTNITITAQRAPFLGGNGFVNIGFIDATGVDLGAITLPGDLGRINAGTVGGSAKVPALKALTVQSVGLLGLSTQDAGGTLSSTIKGALAKLTVNGDLRGAFLIEGTSDGVLGSATIGGSIVGTDTQDAGLHAVAGIGTVKIAGDIRSSANGDATITTDGTLGSVTVAGSIVGTQTTLVRIEGFGQLVAPTKGTDLAIKSVTVKGSVEFGTIRAGDEGNNADASIGSITVSGDWIASSAIAGNYTSAGDNVLFTNDDTLDANPARNATGIAASIASFTVKGQAFGTADNTADMFGIVAEQIGKAKIGARTFAFKAGATKEAFFAAPTITGAGAENPAFDFIIRELGSTTPTINAAGANLTLSTDNKTATFTDVDGDIVTVKRSLGTFSPADFTITPAGIGGLLAALDLTPETAGKTFDVTITAKVGPNGGNGFVNVGEIDARQTDLGNVIIGGELQDLDVGDSNATRIALGSLTVQSLGSIGGTSPSGDEINGKHGLGKITVKTDIRGTDIYSNNPTGNLASLTVGGSVTKSTIQSAAGIGSITIGGSFRDNGRIQANNRIGAITIGGDLNDTEVEIFAIAPLVKGPDNAIGKLTIGGNYEKTNITIGENNNADSGIGAITVGRAWIAGSILASTTKGTDGFAGTGDDTAVSIGIDEPLRFSTIASILIKGQSLGTPADGDHYGIVAQQIGKAQIGSVKFAFKPTSNENFAAAPTGPGKGTFPFDTFDFYIRELL